MILHAKLAMLDLQISNQYFGMFFYLKIFQMWENVEITQVEIPLLKIISSLNYQHSDLIHS